MSANTFEVTAQNFTNEVEGSDQPVLVDFWAEWCGPCKMIAPFVEEIAVENAGKLRVGKLDADQYPEMLERFGIRGIPTLILFKGGQPVTRVTGFMPKGKLWEKLAPFVTE